MTSSVRRWGRRLSRPVLPIPYAAEQHSCVDSAIRRRRVEKGHRDRQALRGPDVAGAHLYGPTPETMDAPGYSGCHLIHLVPFSCDRSCRIAQRPPQLGRYRTNNVSSRRRIFRRTRCPFVAFGQLYPKGLIPGQEALRERSVHDLRTWKTANALWLTSSVRSR